MGRIEMQGRLLSGVFECEKYGFVCFCAGIQIV